MLGIVLVLLGWLVPDFGILTMLGFILIVLGVILALLGSERTGGRRWF